MQNSSAVKEKRHLRGVGTGVFACGEDTHSLCLKSELSELRSEYATTGIQSLPLGADWILGEDSALKRNPRSSHGNIPQAVCTACISPTAKAHYARKPVFAPSSATIHIKMTSRFGGHFYMAAELGFEPRHTESESAVLPLHNSAKTY